MSISVLIVEDDVEIRNEVRRLLEGAGYFVHCAENADQALDLLGHMGRPCLLLWDAITPRSTPTMLNKAMLQGVHVATLPVSVESVRVPGSAPVAAKRLASPEAILSIVREHCPLPEAIGV
jgi:CheY-like chemotaxis protein